MAGDGLDLRPVGGIPRWLGATALKVVLGALSMQEQPTGSRSGPLSPTSGYFRRDRYLAPTVDPDRYTLDVVGLASPQSLGLSDLAALPQEDRVCVQECAGNGNRLMGSAGLMGQAHFAGPSLRSVIDACGGPGAATHLVFRGLDSLGPIRRGYHYGLSLDEVLEAEALIALRMNGEPLSRRHGFPARLVVPRIYSHSHVKWLARIEGTQAPHGGLHNRLIYVNRERVEGSWVKVEARWIGLKSLVTLCRRRPEGGYELSGWAWGGEHGVDRVTVSTDGGDTWREAKVTGAAADPTFEGLSDEALSGAWATFAIAWTPAGGKHRVGARAYDARGGVQELLRRPDVKGDFDQCHVKWRDVVVP